jgi:hypothetical protein
MARISAGREKNPEGRKCLWDEFGPFFAVTDFLTGFFQQFFEIMQGI